MTDQATAPSPIKRAPEKVYVDQQLVLAKRIAKGRLGSVYAGVHPVLARRFAVKVLRGVLTRDAEVLRRLRHTVRETSMVEHPNAVGLTDLGQLTDGRCYLTMEFFRGNALSRVVARDGRFEVERALPLLEQLASALRCAHRARVVHGDVRPSNILLAEDPGGEDQIKLHDFSLVPALSSPPSTKDALSHLRLFGTLDYLSPEQLAAQSVDGRTDVYSFGAVAYHLLTGEPPFVGDPQQVMLAHREIDPVPPSRRSGGEGVPPALDALVLRCLAKQPSDRFKSMDELIGELEGLLPSHRPAVAVVVEEPWEAPEVEEEEEPLPESPARLRRLFYDTIFELSEWLVDRGPSTPDMASELQSMRDLREKATTLAARCELTENRFEDIRRELRERESTLRYAIIDLNLAKSEQVESGDGDVAELVFQISELERSLAQVERQRRERFAELNAELQTVKENLKALEHQMAVAYRRLYAELDEVRGQVRAEGAVGLYRRLKRCRDAMTRMQSRAGSRTSR